MIKGLMKTSLVTPILLALLFVTAGQAFSQIDTAPLYHIVAKHSGKCLEVSGAATGNGVQVIQSDCNETGQNQQWAFTRVEDGYYKILAKHSGKSLDVSGGPYLVHNGIDVKTWDYHGGSNQMWRLIRVEPGFYELRARHSGRSLYIDGGSGAINNGARAQQWDYTGEDNQKFGLIALGARPPCAFTDSLTSTFTGRAVLTTNNPNAPEPFPSNLNLTVKFTNCRRNVDIVTFPAIVNSFNTPLGPNTSTVTMTQGGSGPFNPSNGNMVLSMTLGFENTIRLFGNSTLPLTLTTEGNGTNGNITLSGTGTFMGGGLGGYQGTLTITNGSFSPSPR
jgi:ricin-type beta-trefoil lectin protein